MKKIREQVIYIVKQEFKPLSWLVANYDINANKITYYDVLRYREDNIKKLKKKCETKEEFSDGLRREMMYYYWSKCEAEILIKRTDDNRIILSSWICSNPEDIEIDVTDRTDFDWIGFADKHIKEKGYRNQNVAKIDIFDQLSWNWSDFVNYCWNHRFKYERKRKGE